MISRSPCDEAAILFEERYVDERSPSGAGKWVLAVSILGSSMAFIDGTVVNIALPALQSSLLATGPEVQWVVESYALFLSALLLVGGSLGDLYGRRKTFLIGVGIFTGASVCCGFAGSIHQLIAGRAVQGIGAALLIPGSLALISASFPTTERGRAIGTWSGFTAITAAVGPLLGGLLIQYASWRWVFFLNVPIAAAVFVISLGRVKESRNESGPSQLDWLGASLATTGLGAVTYALIEFSRGGVLVLMAGTLGVMLLTAFVVVEAKSPLAMLPLRLFRSANFSGANLMTLLLYAGLGGVLFYLPLNLIQVQHYSPTAAGGALLPLILLMFLLSRWSGGLVERYGERLPLILGPLVVAAGFALLARPNIGGSYWTTFFPAVVLLGFGLAVSVAPLTTVVMNSVGKENAGAASGVNNAVSRVASLVALAVFGIFFAAAFSSNLKRDLRRENLAPGISQSIYDQRAKLAAIGTNDSAGRMAIEEAFVHGFKEVAYGAFGLSLLASLSAAIFVRTSGKRDDLVAATGISRSP